MKKKELKKLAKFIAALCFLAAPLLLMIIGIWMIYNVGLWIGLGITFVGYAGGALGYNEVAKIIERDRKATE